ncbi:retrovirus-related pol polyprotein from transposon TNT 1-94 [Tanacetum coccineum]|uniref:Retrovirus-related pol polyprotein from transposon TNT 1-94 n=1 Tax=Tanacetum coccineum TaxID=301880 RepID=A0ABQ4WJP3_9ASTR
MKKVRESKPKLYDGNVILKMDTIVIPDSDETLMLCGRDSVQKCFEGTRSNGYLSPSSTTNKVEVPKEFPKVSMVNTSLKELKRHLAGFNQVVKERTTATAITEGTWGFEHTKACFRDEIIPFIKELKDIFNNFNQYLVDELADVQNVFYQMEQAVEQHRLESRTFEVKMNQVLSENERLLAQAIDHDIVKTVVNLSVNDGCETVNECQKCLELKTELLNKKDVVDKETYDKLCKNFTTLEKHCITLEADSQLNQEIFQQKNSVLDQNAPSFTQLFELSELRAQSQEKDTVIVKLKEQIKSLKGNVDDSKVKMDMDKIETLNIELEHRVTKLVAENEHLKQTYKQLYDSIKPKRTRFGSSSPKNEFRKLKEKALDKEAIETHSIDPKVSKDNVEPITPKLLNKRTAHSSILSTLRKEALEKCSLRWDIFGTLPSDLYILGIACPLTRITTTNEVPSRKPIVLEFESPKPVVNLVYSRKPRKNQYTESLSKTEVIKTISTNKQEPSKSGDQQKPMFHLLLLMDAVIQSSSVLDPLLKAQMTRSSLSAHHSSVNFLGLGHNLFSMGQLCDSNLEVAFRQHTCFIRNLEGVDLLTGSRGDNLYTLSLGNMMASSPICLLSKASKTKSWLWHRHLSHLNFGAINHLARHGLVRGLPKLKFEKDHLCSACALGKSSKKPYKPKSEDTNQEKLYLLHMDLCGPMRVASVNGKKYILVIVDDYSRFTWVKCLRSKDEAPVFIINFLKMIQVRLKETVRRIRTDNGTEFVNQTLREYYEKVGISHETSVARSPQQNGVVERRNRTLIKTARTNELIYAKAPLFLWAEAVATACYTQNRSMIRRRHGKTPYELLHDKPPDLSYLHVFGALCYPTNDCENLGKLQPKADIADRDASKHSSSGPALHDMTPVTISSGLVPNPPPSTPFVPPSRSDWDLLFQPMFDESLNPPPYVDLQAPEVIAPIPEVVAPEHAVSTGSPSSTTVDQDAPSPSNSHTTQETK